MAKDEAGNVNTTLSTRFDDREMATLKQAADAKQWSLSRLIRAGAYEKAVNILNAQSMASYSVRRLLSELAEQLFNPKVMMSSGHPDDPGQEFDPYLLGDRFPPDVEIYSPPLNKETALKIVESMKKLGAELAPMFNEEIIRASAPNEVFGGWHGLKDPSLQSADESQPAAPQPSKEGKNPPKKSTSRRARSAKSGN